MKNALMILLLSAVLMSCDGEDKGPTTFKGEVIFPEDYERVADTKVSIFGEKSEGAVGRGDIVVDTIVALDQDRRFGVTFPAVDVTYYSLQMHILNSEGFPIESLNTDCSPYDCSDLKPGERYDLTIEVLE